MNTSKGGVASAWMQYGLKTCPECQKAPKALEAAGHFIAFRDVRAMPLSEAELEELIVAFGDTLVDRNTNDYRALSDWLKNSEAEEQIPKWLHVR